MIGVVWDQPGQLQDVQQLLLVFLVLLGSARVQLEGWLLEERQNFSQCSQLYQVKEVKVAEPLGPFADRQLRIKTLSELRHIVTPLLLKPAVWRKEGNKSECQLFWLFRQKEKENEQGLFFSASPSSRYLALRCMLMLACRPETSRKKALFSTHWPERERQRIYRKLDKKRFLRCSISLPSSQL